MATDRQGIVVPVILRVFAQSVVRGPIAKGIDHLVANEPLAQERIQVKETLLLGLAIVERRRLVVGHQVTDVQAEHEALLFRRTTYWAFLILSRYDHRVPQAEQNEDVLLAHDRCAKMEAALAAVTTC